MSPRTGCHRNESQPVRSGTRSADSLVPPAKLPQPVVRKHVALPRPLAPRWSGVQNRRKPPSTPPPHMSNKPPPTRPTTCANTRTSCAAGPDAAPASSPTRLFAPSPPAHSALPLTPSRTSHARSPQQPRKHRTKPQTRTRHATRSPQHSRARPTSHSAVLACDVLAPGSTPNSPPTTTPPPRIPSRRG